jgi:hypothetical protein
MGLMAGKTSEQGLREFSPKDCRPPVPFRRSFGLFEGDRHKLWRCAAPPSDIYRALWQTHRHPSGIQIGPGPDIPVLNPNWPVIKVVLFFSDDPVILKP